MGTAISLSHKKPMMPFPPFGHRLSPADKKLLIALKELRRSLAMRQSIPAYVVFTDATLVDMCRLKPKTQEEFMEVSGVGQAKSQRYGEVFLAVIAEFSE